MRFRSVIHALYWQAEASGLYDPPNAFASCLERLAQVDLRKDPKTTRQAKREPHTQLVKGSSDFHSEPGYANEAEIIAKVDIEAAVSRLKPAEQRVVQAFSRAGLPGALAEAERVWPNRKFSAKRRLSPAACAERREDRLIDALCRVEENLMAGGYVDPERGFFAHEK